MNLEKNNYNIKIHSIGIIGAGYAAGVHSKVLRTIDDSIIQYIFDVNSDHAQKFSVEYGCRIAETLEELFELVEAVIVATPVWTHHSLVLDALRHKKHILCEKPMALNCAEAEEMFDLSENTNVICAVGFNYRFFDITNRFLDEITGEKIQEIHISIRRLFRNDWRRDETSVLSDLGIHLLDLIAVFSGDKVDTASCRTVMKYINKCDYDSVVEGYTENKIAFILEAARIDDPDEVRFGIEIKSDAKTIQYDSRAIEIYLVTDETGTHIKPVTNEIICSDFFDFFDSVLRQDKQWLSTISGQNRHVLASFGDGYQSQRILDELLSINDARIE